MNPQRNNYLSRNIAVNPNRYNGSLKQDAKRLGDRTLFSQSVDGVRYYSSLDAEIYFGEKYLDDLVQIQWSVEQATMPLFGYNSYVFDDIAIGARQIQGAFTINFIKTRFLYDILQSQTAVDRSSLFDHYYGNENLMPNSNLEREHMPMWDRSFNIRVGYGDYNKQGKDTSMLVLYCAQITGCQQVLSTDGSVIGETYSFIAKDIRYDMNLSSSKDEKPKEESKDQTKVEEKKDVVVLKNIYLQYYESSQVDPLTRCDLHMELDAKDVKITNVQFTLKNSSNSKNVINKVINIDASSSNGVINYVFEESQYGAIKSEIDSQRKGNLSVENRIRFYSDIMITYTENDTSKIHNLNATNIEAKRIVSRMSGV